LFANSVKTPWSNVDDVLSTFSAWLRKRWSSQSERATPITGIPSRPAAASS
jgi:hypothetical protein